MKKTAAPPPDAENAHLEPLKKIRQIVRSAQKHSAAIERRCGVNGAQLWLMTELQARPQIRVGDLVGLMAIQQSTVSNLVDLLVRKGLVQKVRDTRDRRATLLELTETGLQLLKKGPTPTRGMLPEALRSMDGDALARLDASLQQLIDAMRGIDEALGLQLLPFNLEAK